MSNVILFVVSILLTIIFAMAAVFQSEVSINATNNVMSYVEEATKPVVVEQSVKTEQSVAKYIKYHIDSFESIIFVFKGGKKISKEIESYLSSASSTYLNELKGYSIELSNITSAKYINRDDNYDRFLEFIQKLALCSDLGKEAYANSVVVTEAIGLSDTLLIIF